MPPTEITVKEGIEMGVVLILTYREDTMADLVIGHLIEQKIDFVRFNTEEFPQRVQITLQFKNGDWRGELSFPERRLNLKEITAVWNRRPHQPEINVKVEDPIVRDWGRTEAWHTLYTLWGILRDRFWVNPIQEGLYVEDNKWLQLVEARKLGFLTPDSILSNSPTAINTFTYRFGNLAMKKIRTGLLEYPDGRTGILHTIRLHRNDLTESDLQRMELVPVFLQSYVEKRLELRITVVGDQVLACAIYSQEQEDTKSDWRGQAFTHEWLRHEPFELPEEIVERCSLLTQKLGLHYGAIDMALTPDNEYVFFEINQNGEWGWVQMLSGLPISKAIADLLAVHT